VSKKSTAKRGLAFNSIAVVFIMVVVPMAIAFISSAAFVKSDEPGVSIDNSSYSAGVMEQFNWVNNGDNLTSWYEANHPATSSGSVEVYNCLYIIQSICKGVDEANYPNTMTGLGVYNGGALAYAGNNAPFNGRIVPQTHGNNMALAYAPVGYAYYGGSGNGHFTFNTSGEWYLLPSTKSIDTLSVSMIDHQTTYASTSTIFADISYNAKVTFSYGAAALTVNAGNIDSNNKLCYNQPGTQLWSNVCVVGIKQTFDLTSFESLELQTMTDGDFQNLTITFDFYNFKNADGNYIAGTALPFAGIDEFVFGLDATFVDAQGLSFLVRGGALVIGLICVFVAISSTPLYDPVKNRLRGAE